MGSPYKHWEADKKIDGVKERSDTIHGRLVNKSVILELQPHKGTCRYDIMHPSSIRERMRIFSESITTCIQMSNPKKRTQIPNIPSNQEK